VFDGIVALSGLLVRDERVQWFSDFYMPDSALGFRIRPNLQEFRLWWMKGEVNGTYSTDSIGFRNAGRDYRSSRYFFIGDSFTFGAWVARDSTFYGLLENELGEPVITFGVGGYGLVQYDYILRHYCRDLQSGSRVFLCIFANDLEPLPDSSYLADYYDRAGWQPYTRDASIADRLALSRTASWHGARLIARLLFGYGDIAAASDGTILYKRRGTSARYFTDSLVVPVETRMKGIFSFCQSHHLNLAVLLFPSKEAVYSDEYAELFNDDRYLEIERHGYSRIERLASAYDVPLLDLTGLFNLNRNRRLFFKHDPHCNAVGHRLVADTLVSWLAAATWSEP
jgi:hypothetical protein